jgi:FAD:protein FMN transferase
MSTFNRRQFLSLAPAAKRPTSGYWVHVAREAMACRFEVTLPATEPRGIAGASFALDEIDRLEAQLTVYRDDSEVSELNQNAAEAPVTVERGLFELLSLSKQLHRQTEGAFDITAGPLIRCWGFLSRQGRIPDSAELESARRRVGMSQVSLDAGNQSVRFARPGVEINLGSIGKGFALDRASAKLREHGLRTALLSGGRSSVVALGGDQGGWLVGVRHPYKTGCRIATIRLKNAAMATSGAGEQYFVAGGRRYGHILDPRSGVPACGVAGATVVASSGAIADALATAFFVGGAELAERYCRNHHQVLAFLVPEQPVDRPQVFGWHLGATIEAISID